MNPSLPWKTGIRPFLILLPLLGIAAWNSIGFHQLDEYAMVVEFSSAKLGITDPATLSWEHRTRIRPWLQPALHTLTHRVSVATGIHDRFVIMALFRLGHGLATLLALFLLFRSLPRMGLPEGSLKPAAWAMAFVFFVPYLAVRPSSEMSAASMLVLATVCYLKILATPEMKPRVLFLLAMAIGMWTALAFQFRYQTAAATLGLLAHGIFFRKDRLRLAAGYLVGFLPVTAGAMAIDVWGYGRFTVAFWNYFDYNLIRGVAASMGTKPFWAGFTISAQGPWAPLIALVLMASYLFWLRFPKHPLTWITLPFWLLHAAIGHKEPRFLYPMAWHAAAMMLLFYFTPTDGEGWGMERLFHRMSRWRAVRALRYVLPVFLALNFLAFAYFLFTPVRSEIACQREIYHQAGQSTSELISVGLSPYQNVGEGGMFYYRPPHLSEAEVATLADWPGIQRKAMAPEKLFLSIQGFPDEKTLAADLARKGFAPRLIHRSLPPWIRKVNAGNWLSRTRHWSLYLLEPLPPPAPRK